MMQLLKSLKIAGLLVLTCSTTTVVAQTTAISADTPASVSGTYSLSYTTGSTPFAANTNKTFVLDGATETLCVDGKSLGKAFLRTAGASEPLWVDGTTYYGLSVVNGNFNEINVYTNSNNSWVGQFTGARTSTATTCGAGSSSTPTISTSAQTMFDVAAQVYPTLLVNGSALGLYQGYVYRFFAASGIYVGIKDDIVYTLGGPFGNVIKPQGSVTLVLSALQNAKAKLDQQNNNPGIPSGLYNLTVTGRVTMMGFAIDIPEIKLLNLPAPQPTDTTALADTVKTSLGATGFAVSKVTVINNTANRVTFRLEATATAQGVSVTYDLLYDYTK